MLKFEEPLEEIKKEPFTQEFKYSYLNVFTSYLASLPKRKSAYLKGALLILVFFNFILYGFFRLVMANFFVTDPLKNECFSICLSDFCTA